MPDSQLTTQSVYFIILKKINPAKVDGYIMIVHLAQKRTAVFDYSVEKIVES